MTVSIADRLRPGASSTSTAEPSRGIAFKVGSTSEIAGRTDAGRTAAAAPVSTGRPE